MVKLQIEIASLTSQIEEISKIPDSEGNIASFKIERA